VDGRVVSSELFGSRNILLTVVQLSISQKALRALPVDGSIVPKHVGATILNQ
jgi:hypothetical protein